MASTHQQTVEDEWDLRESGKLRHIERLSLQSRLVALEG